jgi:hypothetical protein
MVSSSISPLSYNFTVTFSSFTTNVFTSSFVLVLRTLGVGIAATVVFTIGFSVFIAESIVVGFVFTTGGLVTGGFVTGGLVTGGFVTGGLVVFLTTGGFVTGGFVTGGLVTGGFVTGGLVVIFFLTTGGAGVTDLRRNGST